MSFETGEWSLAKDKELIDKLEQRSAEFLPPLVGIPQKLDQLSTETAQLNLLLQNVVGDLNTLSERRFIENRVAEAHDEPAPATPEVEPGPASDDELRLAVRTGLKAFGLLPVDELSDDDDDPTGYECFARDRPFSLIIGSKQWLEADPFEGVTPLDTVSVGGTPICEAMEDLVLPSTSDDIEEATEAEAWHQRERAAVSTQGEHRAADSDSESSTVSAAYARSSVPPLASELAATKPPRGLFDDDSDDDDDGAGGDLFGVVRKPSASSGMNEKPSWSSAATQSPLATGQAASRRESAASLLQDVASTEPKIDPGAHTGPVSFLEELKRKTAQKKSDPTTPAAADGDRRLPSLPQLPSKAQPTLAQKQTHSMLDSDSESEIFATKPQPSKSPSSLSQAAASQTRNSFSSPSTGQSRPADDGSLQPRKASLLDSEVEDEDSAQRHLRKPSLPKVSSLLSKKHSLFEDSDSDSDIFGPPKTATPAAGATFAKAIEQPRQAGGPSSAAEGSRLVPVRPKQLKGVRVLPQIPAKPLEDKDEGHESPPRSPAPPPPLNVSISNSRETSTPNSREPLTPRTAPLASAAEHPQRNFAEQEKHAQKVTLPAVRPKQLPTKVPNLFGDSDSDDDLFGRSSLAAKTTTAKSGDKISDTIKQTAELSALHKAPQQSDAIRASEKPPALRVSSAQTFETAPFVPEKSEGFPAAINVTGKPEETKRETAPLLLEAKSRQSHKSQVSGSSASSSDSDSDGNFHQNLKSVLAKKTTARAAIPPQLDGGKDTDKDESTDKDRVRDKDTDTDTYRDMDTDTDTYKGKDKLKNPDDKLADSEPRRVEAAQEPLEVGNASAEDSATALKMADKSSSVKKIAMGLPAGFLQGLKARQQQLGIAQPEVKRRDSSHNNSSSDAGGASHDSETPKPRQAPTETPLAMKSEHKDVVEIAKTRVRGPTGRRLPSRRAAKDSAPLRGESQAERTQPETATAASVVETHQLSLVDIASEADKSKRPSGSERDPLHAMVAEPEDAELVDAKEKQAAGRVETVKSPPEKVTSTTEKLKSTTEKLESTVKKVEPTTEKLQQKKPASVSEKQAERKEPPKPKPKSKSKSIFASDSSDDDLFSPKAPPRKKSLGFGAQESASARPITKSTVAVVDDPLSAAFAAASEKAKDEQRQPVTAEPATRPLTTRVEKAQTDPPKAKPSRSLFSDLEDEDDGGEQLFASAKSKALPKSATMSSLTAGRTNKPKLATSKSAAGSLFASDSDDSDELFGRK